MRLRNKILSIILGLVLLNLIREYVWVKPPDCEHLSFTAMPIEFDIQRKGWDYYSSVFNRKAVSVKISLPLALHGTIISDPQKSFAVIEDLSNGKQDLYRLGDTVGSAKIVAMNRDRVILDYDGTKQELYMSEAGPRTYVQSKTLNKSLDFAKLMTQLRIKPHFENGRCIGFQIGNLSGTIKQMGLQDGDIVESINGVKVDDPLKALEILYGIERNNPVHLSIDRQDEKIELDCKVEG